MEQNIVFKQIVDKIEEYDTIIIHRHENSDPDAFGSQGGLATVIKNSYPEKKVYCVGEDNEGISWINTMDKIADDVYQGSLVIVTDTSNRPRVDDQRYDTGAYLIKIDHHPDVDEYGDIAFVNTKASSCSEIITDLINSSDGRLTLNKKAAEQLYSGIIGDTGRFMYNATTPHTMRIAAQLMEFGFDASQLNRNLSDISQDVARLSGYVWANMTITEHNAAYIVLTTEKLKEFNLTVDQTPSIVALLGQIKSVLVWTLVIEGEDGEFRLRIRSKGPIINGLAAEYNGGGHPLASGAVLPSLDGLDEYVRKLDQIAADYKGE